MPRFVDRVVIHAKAGTGGHGCASVHRESSSPLAGPTGKRRTRRQRDPRSGPAGTYLAGLPLPSACTGAQRYPGHGGHRNGANGDDLILKVPDGTVVLDDDGRILADLVGAGRS